MFRRALSVLSAAAFTLAAVLLTMSDSARANEGPYHTNYRYQNNDYYAPPAFYYSNYPTVSSVNPAAASYPYGASAYDFGPTAGTQGMTVVMTVKVPPDATIWFDGERTSQTGSLRRFISPPIDPKRNFSYSVRAKWMEGKQLVDQTRRVAVHAGEQLLVDFTAR